MPTLTPPTAFPRFFLPVLLSLVALSRPASGADQAAYQFDRVIDSPAGSSYGVPAVNSRGDIAFRRTAVPQTPSGPADLIRGVYKFRDGVLTPVFERRTTTAGPVYVDINDAGQVATLLQTDSLQQLYRGSGNNDLTLIADNTGAFRRLENGLSRPRIGNDGRVLFQGIRADDVGGIYDGPDPVANRVADSTGPLGYPQLYGVRPDGAVMFRGRAPGGPLAVYTGTDGQPNLVFDFGSLGNTEGFVRNSRGDVAFRAFTPTVQGIFTGPDPVADLLASASESGPFFNVFDPQVSDTGVVAFTAALSLNGNARGLFVGPDAVADKVIATGDALFGSTVTGLGIGDMDPTGRVYFSYSLANGQAGIASIVVPEPTSVGLLVLGALATLGRRRRG